MRSDSAGPFLEAASIGDHGVNRPSLDTAAEIGGVSTLKSVMRDICFAPTILPTKNSLVIGDPSPLMPAAIPLTDSSLQQLAATQQHMLVQFQHSMLMMAQTFSAMWQTEMDLLHEVLDRLVGLKRQVRGLSARQKKQSTRRIRANSKAPNEAEQNGSDTHRDVTLHFLPNH
jgi:hypothetical protein